MRGPLLAGPPLQVREGIAELQRLPASHPVAPFCVGQVPIREMILTNCAGFIWFERALTDSHNNSALLKRWKLPSEKCALPPGCYRRHAQTDQFKGDGVKSVNIWYAPAVTRKCQGQRVVICISPRVPKYFREACWQVYQSQPPPVSWCVGPRCP